MTVNRDPAVANESSLIQNSSGAGSDSHKLKDFFSGKKASDRENDRVLYGKLKACSEIETDQESTGSSEDVESPRSVVAKMKKWPNSLANKNVNLYVHSQILRIREEDSHIGEDIAENLSTIGAAMNNNKFASDESDDDHRYHHVDVWIFLQRPILPASPLSGKTIKSEFH